jgi:hypothetical protein
VIEMLRSRFRLHRETLATLPDNALSD